jgi:hypothetical protein
MTLSKTSNTNIPFATLSAMMDYVERKFAEALPKIGLNRNTALPLFAGPMSGAPLQMIAVVQDETGAVKGVAAAYSDKSPVDGNRVCFSPLFLSDSIEATNLLVAEIDEFSVATGSKITRIESHLSCVIPGMQAQTMTYVKER